MSSVDNRIVQMEFDNKRFESNVKTTMSTLDKLKQKLSFNKETKELQEFQNASDNFTMEHMASAIDKIGDKFSMLGMIGLNVMNRIANAAVDAGAKLIKSLTIDQMAAGFEKYTEETNSVQAIYSAVKPKGKSLQDVYSTLDKLAKYTDETSYNYTVMTGTLANFIGKGLEMERSERMLEGIANAAATAGVGVQTANTLFRNWADAVSKGYLQLKDWQSMKLVHMDTEAFVNELIDMAKVVGTVDAKTGKLSKDLTGVGKTAKDVVVDVNNFEELLRYGFINTEVISRVMEKYADQTTKFGLDAFHAAQQARTFADVMGALKDAASTNWSKSYKLIFGDLEEATDLFSTMADSLLVVVGEIGEVRNKLLQGWRNLGGRDTVIEGLSTWWESFEEVRAAIGDALKDTFGIKELANILQPYETLLGEEPEEALDPGILLKWSEAFKTAADNFSEWLHGPTMVGGKSMESRIKSITDVFGGLFSTIHIGFKFLGGVGAFFSSIRKQLGPTFDALLFYAGKIGNWLSRVSDYVTKHNVFERLGTRLANIFYPITSRLPGLITNIANLYDRIRKFLKLNPKAQKAWSSIKRMFNTVLDSLPMFVNGAIEFSKYIFNFVKNSDEWKWVEKNFNRYIRPLISNATEFSGALADAISKFFSMDTSGIRRWWDKLKARFEVFKELGPLLASYWEDAKKNFPFLQDLEDFWNNNQVVKEIREFVGAIGQAIYRFFNLDVIDPDYSNSIFGQLKLRFENAWYVFKTQYLDPKIEELKTYFTNKWAEWKKEVPFLQSLEDFLTSIFGSEKESKERGETVGKTFSKGIAPVLEYIKGWFSNLTVKDIFKYTKKFAALFVTLNALWTILRTFKATVEFVESVNDTIWQVYATLRARKMSAWAATFLEFAASAGILALSLKLIGGMEWEEIGKGLAGMAGIFAEEGVFFLLMNRMASVNTKTKNFKNLGQGLKDLNGSYKSNSLLSFGKLIGTATSVLILAGTLKKLGSMEWGDIGKGLTAMAGIFGEEGTFMVLVNNLSKASSGSKISASGGLFKGFTFLKEKFSGGNTLGILSLIGTATSISMLAGVVQKLGETDWATIGKGLTGMAGIFAEEGTFMVLVRNLTKEKKITAKDSLNIGSLIATAGSIKVLADAVVEIGAVNTSDAVQGLIGVGALFAEEGAFMVLVRNLTKASKGGSTSLESGGLLKGFSFFKDKFSGSDPLGIGSLIATAGSIKILADAVVEIGTINITDAAQGLAGIGVLFGEEGAFMVLVRKFSDNPVEKNPLATGTLLATAGSIKILADAVVEVGNISTANAVQGLIGVGALLFGEGAFITIVRNLNKEAPTKDPLSSGILLSIAVNMKILGDKLVELGSMGWEGVLPGLAAMGSLFVGDGAMIALISFLSSKNMLNIGAVLKGAAALVVVAAAVGLAISVLEFFTGNAIADFSDKIAIVGANMQQFAESTGSIDTDNSKSKIRDLVDMAEDLALIGLKDYGSLSSFRTNFVRTGADMKLFASSTSSFDSAKSKQSIIDLVEIATTISTMPDVQDKSNEIANLGGALKLFTGNIVGKRFAGLPNMSELVTFFSSLDGLEIDQDMVTEVSKYGDAATGTSFATFAIGLTTLGTACEEFSKSAETLKIGEMTEAIKVLQAINDLNTGLEGVAIANLGPFSAELHTQAPGLSNLAADVVLLGSALESFGESIGGDNIDLQKMDHASEVLTKVADLGEHISPEGGLKQWFTGTQSLTRFSANLRILGDGAAKFANAINAGDFNSEKVTAAGDTLKKIIDVNNQLPATGGIKQWFTGEADVNQFASDLPGIGTAIAGYISNLGTSKITNSSLNAFTVVERLLDVQNKIKNYGMEYMIDETARFASTLPSIATSIVSFNDTLTGETLNRDTINYISRLLNDLINMQVKLAKNKSDTLLGDVGAGLYDFFSEIKGINAGDYSESGDVITSIFTAISETSDFSVFVTLGESMISSIIIGITNKTEELVGSGGAIAVMCIKAAATARTYRYRFYNVGLAFSSGLATGMSDNSSAVANAAANVVTLALEAAKEAAEMNSPWRTTQEMGMYFDYGLAQGMNNYSSVVEQSSKSIANEALNPVLEELKMVASLPFDELDLRPTIRPVLDLSDVSAGASSIGNMFADQRVRMHGLDTRTMENYAATLGNLDRTNNSSSIMQSINDINTRIDNLGKSIRSMRVVLNTGKVVGGIEDEMDKALGMRMIMSERGNS